MSKRAWPLVGIPATLDGVDVVVRISGPIRAIHHRPSVRESGLPTAP